MTWMGSVLMTLFGASSNESLLTTVSLLKVRGSMSDISSQLTLAVVCLSVAGRQQTMDTKQLVGTITDGTISRHWWWLRTVCKLSAQSRMTVPCCHIPSNLCRWDTQSHKVHGKNTSMASCHTQHQTLSQPIMTNVCVTSF